MGVISGLVVSRCFLFMGRGSYCVSDYSMSTYYGFVVSYGSSLYKDNGIHIKVRQDYGRLVNVCGLPILFSWDVFRGGLTIFWVRFRVL